MNPLVLWELTTLGFVPEHNACRKSGITLSPIGNTDFRASQYWDLQERSVVPTGLKSLLSIRARTPTATKNTRSGIPLKSVLLMAYFTSPSIPCLPLDVGFLASAGKNNQRGDGKKNEITNAVGGWIVHYHISFPIFLVLLSVQND